MTAPSPGPAPVAPSGEPLVEVRGLSAGYGRSTVLRDVDLTVRRGSVVAVLGPNGAGKTTLLRTLTGSAAARTGTITVAGRDVTSLRPHARCRHGLGSVPEGRGIFRGLSVRDNLRLGLPRGQRSIDPALELFPELTAKIDTRAGSLSGGQQQMVSLARAYLGQPKVLLIDEVSLGLAPRLIDSLFASLRRLAANGTSLVIVEQYVHRALAIADHVLVLDRGSAVFVGSPKGLGADTLMASYLGIA